MPVSGLFWCHTHNMPWECCECTEIDLNMHSKGVFNHMQNKEDKPRIENDSFVVLHKTSSQWPDNVYHETDLQTAMFFNSYEGALSEARERAIKKNITARVYRVHPVCKLAPQEPKIELVKGEDK